MHLTSTRGNGEKIAPAEAITRGIAGDGGLFVPEFFPAFPEQEFNTLAGMSYQERAFRVLSRFLTDFSDSELRACIERAYTGKFDSPSPAPLVEVADGMHFLELWHGPTCAFKDMALQLLPHLMTAAISKTAPGRTLVILVATSGDTGKAALEGFADVPGTEIAVFYPRDGVSSMQKRQMVTQTGHNVAICAIEGNFDDAQSAVKRIFADESMRAELASKNRAFSSANSINFGRLVPQIVYYVSAYCDLLKSGKLRKGETFNIAVPTGNFGDILAAVYAREMGVPAGKLICASNINHILTDFIRTGVYDINRPFHITTSPSMDILISSNLERLLYLIHGNDPKIVYNLMAKLRENGRYEIGGEPLKHLQTDFFGEYCDDSQTAAVIGKLFREHHYLCDTHTAVAVHAYQRYLEKTGDKRPCVIASTASPYKFASAVLPAVSPDTLPDDEFARIELLSRITGMPVPAPLSSLKDKKVIHTSCVKEPEMRDFLRQFLR